MAAASSSGAAGTPADVTADLHLPWETLGQLIEQCQQGDASLDDVAAAYAAMDAKSKLKPKVRIAGQLENRVWNFAKPMTFKCGFSHFYENS